MNLIALEFDKNEYSTRKQCINQISDCQLDYDVDGEFLENDRVFAYQVGTVFREPEKTVRVEHYGITYVYHFSFYVPKKKE